MARSVRLEASLAAQCVDVGETAAACGRSLVDDEPEVVLSPALTLLVPRLKTAPLHRGGALRLQLRGRGALSNLQLESQPEVGVRGDGLEVILRVRAVGLNFRDVLNVLGEYPGDPGPPGSDCAGVLSGQADGAPDEYAFALVFGAAHAPLASIARSTTQLLSRKPSTLTFEQSSTLPVVWRTSHTACGCAQLRCGQTIVVHALAGGVGLKALEYTWWVQGAILGSAGGRHKHMQLGSVECEQVSSSRDGGAFALGAAWLLGASRARAGVNSLSFDFIVATLMIIGESGSFEEIGKRGVWAPERHQASSTRITTYQVIALDTETHIAPERVCSSLIRLGARADSGIVTSLPLVSYELEAQYELAFRTLQAGRNTGKVVLRIVSMHAMRTGFHLVTGGSGGLGRLTGRWLTEHGVRHVVLASRRVGANNANNTYQSALHAQHTSWERCDSGDSIHTRRLVCFAPLTAGIWHAAGVLADAVLSRQSGTSLGQAYSPKAHGAWSLHLVTVVTDLRSVVYFSSMAALLGSAGQTNYAAANACLDSLSSHRRAGGGRGVSVQWGPWAEVGMAVGGAAAKRMVFLEGTLGLRRLEVAQGLAVLAVVVRPPAPSLVGALAVSWARWLQNGGSTGAPFISMLLLSTSPKPIRVAETYTTGSSTGWEATSLLDVVVEIVQRTAGGGHVDADIPLMEAGIDSLGAVELRNLLQAVNKSGTSLSSTLVFDHPTARQLASTLMPERRPPAAMKSAGLPDEMLCSRSMVSVDGMSIMLPGGVCSRLSATQVAACGFNAISEVPSARWELGSGSVPLGPLTSRVRHGGFVWGIELADHAAFSISRAEAAAMDPCQRLLL
ncbi:MAG: KR domain-containing protein, partial [Candidatus Limnocylindrus sp.]